VFRDLRGGGHDFPLCHLVYGVDVIQTVAPVLIAPDAPCRWADTPYGLPVAVCAAPRWAVSICGDCKANSAVFGPTADRAPLASLDIHLADVGCLSRGGHAHVDQSHSAQRKRQPHIDLIEAGNVRLRSGIRGG
jgi:hypothetical protein